MKITIYNNYKIIIGQNQKDNWEILTDADQNSLLFHLSSFPSCYVICKGKFFDSEIIRHCAYLCLQHTKYKNMKGVFVDYTTIKNVYKGTVEGEIFYKSSKKVSRIKI